MENRTPLLVFVVLAVVALFGGVAVGAMLLGGDGSAAPTPTAQAHSSDLPSPGETSSLDRSEPASAEAPSGEDASDAPPTQEPSTATGTPAPPSSPAPAPAATMTITQLRLDAQDDPSGQDRVLRFVTGPGPVTVDLATITPQGSTVFCLNTPTQELGCKTAGEGRLNAKTTKARETFLVTLRGEDVAQPVVEVTLTFPAADPSVTIENARFDGTGFPDTNGIQAIVTPRAAGDMRITAEWGGKPFLYEITLIEQGGSGGTSFQPDEASIGTDTALPIAPPNPWKVVLQNIDEGFGVTPMTATVAWP